MLDPELYEGREQTYVKHFVLEQYLERVAYNIFSFQTDFVYVDGFSGPWKSENDTYQDTSFKLAIDKLRAVRDSVKRRGRNVKIKCMFIEKETKPFEELRAAVDKIYDIEIKLINGKFEDHIADIQVFAHGTFSLIFIDPTGWQGFALHKIKPLLNLRGEVLINFMSDFINRFLEDSRPEIASTFDELFGPNWYEEWRELVSTGLSREAAAIGVYSSRLKELGNLNFVTSTRILKPTAEKSYFYLIYGTQHPKGVQEFRRVEKKTIDAQERVRNAAKYKAEVERTGQESLFGNDAPIKNYEEERKSQLARGRTKLLSAIGTNTNGIRYENLIGQVLEIPLVWEEDLKRWLRELRSEGKIDIPEITGRQRVPKAPERLWRRLCVTAFEDVGVADIESVSLVTSALKGKTWRSQIGGEWPVASYLVGRLARAINCRATVDLLTVAAKCPAHEKARLDLAHWPTSKLIAYATSEVDLPTRAMALWYAVGTQRYPSRNLHQRRGDSQAVFDHLW